MSLIPPAIEGRKNLLPAVQESQADQATTPRSGKLALYACIFFGFLSLYYGFQNAGYLDATDAEERYGLVRSMVDRSSVLILMRAERNLRPSKYSIGSAIAAVPFYMTASRGSLSRIEYDHRPQLVRGVTGSTVFYSALWMVLLAAVGWELFGNRRVAFVLAALAGTATLAWPYSKSFQTENFTGMLLAATTLSMLTWLRNKRLWTLGLAGLLFGYALCVKTELAVLAPVYGVALAAAAWHFESGTRKRLTTLFLTGAVFSAGALPGVLGVLGYNYARFGSPVSMGYPEFNFSHPLFKGLYLQLISAGKGLFWYCPILFAAAWFVPRFCRQKGFLAAWLMLAPMGVMLLLYSKWFSPCGDAALGPRFMVSYAPLLLLALGSGLNTTLSTRAKRWIVGLACLSIAINLMNASTSFLLYFHAQLFSVPEAGRDQVMDQFYYSPSKSLLLGNLGSFVHKFLDLRFVRWRPTEDSLLILRPFWMCLAGTWLFLGSAWRISGDTPCRKGGILWVTAPAVLLFVLGLLRVGDYSDNAIKLKYKKNNEDYHVTWCRNIELQRLSPDRILSLAFHGESAVLAWSGYFKVPKDTTCTLHIKCVLPTQAVMDGNELKALPGDAPEATLRTTHLTRGWHKMEIIYPTAGDLGIKVRMQMGDETPARLDTFEWRSRPPHDASSADADGSS